MSVNKKCLVSLFAMYAFLYSHRYMEGVLGFIVTGLAGAVYICVWQLEGDK